MSAKSRGGGGKASGFTLIELIISMSMFLLLLGLIFLLFGIGSKGFRTVEARQGAQNQLAAVRSAFQNDLQVSHFYGVRPGRSTSYLINGVEQRRDSLSAVALSDWEDRDEFGLPDWDYWAYYRVTNEEHGQLIRHKVRPEPGQHGPDLLREADLPAGIELSAQPFNPAWGKIKQTQVLARSVRSMTVALDQAERAVEISLTVEQKTDEKNPKPDVITATFYIKPHNTVPTD